MTDFVPVHGAWGGDWTMAPTLRDLTAAGHRAVSVALRGLGSRAGELDASITLGDHIADVCTAVAASGFGRFVLVGHSYGGMVITGAAARLGASIDRLVYVDAFLPGHGQSLWDISGDFEHDHYIAGQRDAPGLVAPLPGLVAPVSGGERFGRHPLLTLIEPVRLGGDEGQVRARSYIHATGWAPTPFGRFARMAKADAAWDYHEADCGHDVMGERPAQLLAILTGGAV